jgi:uncharacterized membrane-anchored protein
MNRAVLISALLGILIAAPVHAQSTSGANENQIRQELRALHWVFGPTTATVAGNSTLVIPDGYVYLNPEDTAKFDAINQNLSDGKEVMIAPKSLQWSAFLEFDDAGYVRDTEKIDAPAVLKSLIADTDAANTERQQKGWAPLHVVGWSMQPRYNNVTKRLEWAILVRSSNGDSSNFFTKILGRRGYTSVVLVADPQDASAAISTLDQVLTGFRFNSGERYADYEAGDKVAEYGLAGLILGGAAAAAVKTGILAGLLKFLVAGAAAAWKFLAAAAAAGIASVRAFFRRKKAKQSSPEGS